MTVSSLTNKASFSANGSTTVFAYNFKIFADADLEVISRAADGTETIKTLSTHYNVSGAGSDGGGNVTFTAGNTPANGTSVIIRRSLALTQSTDYVENDTFAAENHEDALDRLTFVTQSLQEQLDRTFKVSKTTTITTPEVVEAAADRASKALVFSSNGNALEIGPTASQITTAQTYATNASNSADASASSAAAAAASYDSFDDRYLGAKSSDPSTDNDGASLITGALYFNSSTGVMMVYTGSAWVRTTPTSSDQTTINAVNSNATNINTVSGISANVSTVAGIASNVTSVAGNAANVNKVAAVDANVTKVANIDSDVTAVANIDSDVAAVQNIAANVTTVAGVAANVTTVAGVASNVTTVAGVASNVTTVAGVASNVTTVAGISSDVTTVAGIAGDVSAVAAQVVGYDFSTTTAMADPGSGNVRFNNATLASVSQIALDDLDKNGVDQSAFIILWDDSTNTIKGTLVFRTAGGDVATFLITDLTDNSGWNQIAVTHVASSGTFSNGEDVFIGFTRAGDKGADGEGSGDVVGPGSATDNTVARFNNTTGKLLQGSGVTIDDSNNLGAASLTLTTDLAVAHGGTGSSSASDARAALGAAALGANSDITSITGLTTDLSVAQGGTGASTFAANGILFGNGASAIGATAVGTATQVLTSNGSGVAPTFSSDINVPGSVTSGTIFLAATDTDTSNTGSITIDFSAHQNFVLTLTGSITLANPSTEAVGQCGVFVFIQDGSGSRTLSLGTDYETAASEGITLSTAANSVDVVPYFVKASGSIQLGSPQLAFG